MSMGNGAAGPWGCWVGLERGVVSSEPAQGTGTRLNRGARQASGSVPEGIWVPWAEWGLAEGLLCCPYEARGGHMALAEVCHGGTSLCQGLAEGPYSHGLVHPPACSCPAYGSPASPEV